MKRIGVTLIEILISVVIVAFAFLAILGVIQFGNKSTVKVNNYSKAFRLAQEFIEECKHHPIGKFLADENIVGADNWFDEINMPVYCPKSKKAIEDFQGELKNLEFKPAVKVVRDGGGIVKFILLRVAVTWHEGDGTTALKPRQIHLANAIYNPASE
jgi:hypothetical protein